MPSDSHHTLLLNGKTFYHHIPHPSKNYHTEVVIIMIIMLLPHFQFPMTEFHNATSNNTVKVGDFNQSQCVVP